MARAEGGLSGGRADVVGVAGNILLIPRLLREVRARHAINLCFNERNSERNTVMRTLLALGIVISTVAFAQTPNLKSIHKIYIDKMPNDLDQYLRAEFFKQMKGKVEIVLEEKDADGILTGVSEEKTGTGAQITGRYLGLHDNATGSLSLVDKDRKSILWSDEAGDRSLMFGVFKRGGERKVADRLVGKLKKAMGY